MLYIKRGEGNRLNSSIFVPKTINVGYQNRSGTYTGRLAYVIYYDGESDTFSVAQNPVEQRCLSAS